MAEDPFKIVWLVEIAADIVLLLIAAIFFLRESRRSRDMKILARYYKGMSIFFFFLSVNGIFDFLEQYARYILLQPTLFPTEYWVFPALAQTLMNTTSFCIIISLLHISFAILSYQLETHILQSKRRPRTIILAICLATSIVAFFGRNFDASTQGLLSLVDQVTLGPFALIIMYWGIYYLVLAKRSVGSIRHKAILVGLGLGFIMGGIIIDILYRGMFTDPTAIVWFFPVLSRSVGVLGIPMIFFGFRRKEEI